MKNKQHQVKSKMYYYFWGVCTVAVVAGQLYVGAGYREMADEVFYLTEFLRGVEETNVIVDY
jgi:hypothetical protein